MQNEAAHSVTNVAFIIDYAHRAETGQSDLL
jgi:hypothetical protein